MMIGKYEKMGQDLEVSLLNNTSIHNVSKELNDTNFKTNKKKTLSLKSLLEVVKQLKPFSFQTKYLSC